MRQLQSPAANISMENHEFGLPPAHYELWPELGATFDILTTTRDRRGVEYVSTIEHKRFPFFGSQVHACFIHPALHASYFACAPVHADCVIHCTLGTLHPRILTCTCCRQLPGTTQLVNAAWGGMGHTCTCMHA